MLFNVVWLYVFCLFALFAVLLIVLLWRFFVISSWWLRFTCLLNLFAVVCLITCLFGCVVLRLGFGFVWTGVYYVF